MEGAATQEVAWDEISDAPTLSLLTENLSKILEIPEFTGDEIYTDEIWSYHWNQALAEGETEEKAEERAQEHCAVWINAYSNAYLTAREATIEKSLDLVNIRAKFYNEWTILSPINDWTDSCKLIIELINGVGYFHYASLSEFLETGPWSLREAVKKHLHTLTYYGSIYGSGSPEQIFEKELARSTRHL